MTLFELENRRAYLAAHGLDRTTDYAETVAKIDAIKSKVEAAEVRPGIDLLDVCPALELGDSDESASREWHELKCPECGHDDEIDVSATLQVRLTAHGSDADASEDGSHEWSDDSAARCVACGFDGRVTDFQPEAFPAETPPANLPACPGCGWRGHAAAYCPDCGEPFPTARAEAFPVEMPPEVLANGAKVRLAFPCYERAWPDARILVCDTNGQSGHRFATWWQGRPGGETIWGHYFHDAEAALADARTRVERMAQPLPWTRDELHLALRDSILAALDTFAAAHFEAGKDVGAADSDLPALFRALDAQADALAARHGNHGHSAHSNPLAALAALAVTSQGDSV